MITTFKPHEDGTAMCHFRNIESIDPVMVLHLLQDRNGYQEIGNGNVCGQSRLSVSYNFTEKFPYLVVDVPLSIEARAVGGVRFGMIARHRSSNQKQWDYNFKVEDETLTHANFTTSLGQYLLTMNFTCSDNSTDIWMMSFSASPIENGDRVNVTSSFVGDIEVVSGSNETHYCYPTGSIIHYNYTVSWMKDGKLIPLNSSQKITFTDGNTFMRISSFDLADEGNYSCVVTNGVMTEHHNSVLRVKRDLFPVVAYVGIATLTVALLIIVAYFTDRRRKWIAYNRRIKSILAEIEQCYLRGKKRDASVGADDDAAEMALYEPYNGRLELRYDHIQIQSEIASGNFGKVMRGKLKYYDNKTCDIDVAIKAPKDSTDKDQFLSLIYEIKILAFVGCHRNITHLFGALTNKIKMGEMYVVFEYWANGSLKDYLDNSTYVSDKSSAFNGGNSSTRHLIDRSDLLKFCTEICCGMEYLSSRNVRICLCYTYE